MPRLRRGRGWCGWPISAPVAAGFWRLALAFPFLLRSDSPAQPGAGRAGRSSSRCDCGRRSSPPISPPGMRHPVHQARQRDLVRQFRQLRLRRLRPVAGAALAEQAQVLALLLAAGGAGAADGRKLRACRTPISAATCSPCSPGSLHRLPDRGGAGADHASGLAAAADGHTRRGAAAARSASGSARGLAARLDAAADLALSSQVIGQGLLVYAIGPCRR